MSCVISALRPSSRTSRKIVARGPRARRPSSATPERALHLLAAWPCLPGRNHDNRGEELDQKSLDGGEPGGSYRPATPPGYKSIQRLFGSCRMAACNAACPRLRLALAETVRSVSP